MSGAAKGALIGVLVVFLIVVGAVVGVAAGLVPNPLTQGGADRVLVIASAPDVDGVEVAGMAFVVEPGSSRVALLNTLETATVSGTSATTARDALPFGGGAAVAQALASQTGGEQLEWVVVPSTQWAPLVDEAGGVSVEVPSAVSAYGGGALTLLQPGAQRLSGAEAVALASAAPFLGNVNVQSEVLGELSAGVSAILGSTGSRVKDLVAAGKAESSLDAEDVPVFQPGP